MLIKENTGELVSIYLINNQGDKPASSKTKVDFDLKLDMDLQLQGTVSQGVLALLPPQVYH